MQPFASTIATIGLIGTTLLCGLASAQADETAVKIGVLSDMGGIFSAFGGPGSVTAATMAVEDFGGRVLGKQVEIVSGDHQNKPDIGLGIARRWYDVEGVDAIFDVLNSGLALPLQALTESKNRLVFFSGANNLDLNGKQCSEHGYVWGYDSYSLSNANVTGIIQKPGNESWFFITIDYASGHNLERDAMSVVKKNGGTVVGSVRYPLGMTDYGSILLQAQSSGAKVIALATGGADMQNILKQAKEFNLTQRIAPLFLTTMDIQGLGLEFTKGAPLVVDFYWDQNEATRAFGKRFLERHKRMPTDVQATVYSAVLNYLKAVQKAGTKDTKAVITSLKELPVEDFMTDRARIRDDGRLLRNMYFGEVKAPAESKSEFDFVKILSTIPGDAAFRPAAESECPALKKN
jgi:branched-chain amino acid transport system substrate-binding protein